MQVMWVILRDLGSDWSLDTTRRQYSRQREEGELSGHFRGPWAAIYTDSEWLY